MTISSATHATQTEYKRIPLGNDRYAIVDADNFKVLVRYPWHVSSSKGRYHAVHTRRAGANHDARDILMHRWIVRARSNELVFHRNGDGLDNRRENLRVYVKKSAERKFEKGSPGWSSLRFSVLLRDDFTCRYCGASGSETKLHIDHRISRYDGGTDDPDNLLTACIDCNLGKGKKSVKTQ